MDTEITVQSEARQTEKNNRIWYLLYVESKKKKKDTNELIYKTELYPQTRKTNLGYQRGRCGEEGGVMLKKGIN